MIELLCSMAAAFVGETAVCPPPATAVRHARLTVYDTALCEPGVACLQGNGDGYFASMIPVSADWYGRMAACPAELYGQWVSLPAVNLVLYCGDSFGTLDGAPVETVVWDNTLDDWAIRIDVFWPVAAEGLPTWNYWLTQWEN